MNKQKQRAERPSLKMRYNQGTLSRGESGSWPQSITVDWDRVYVVFFQT